jgi:hypothetical protein
MKCLWGPADLVLAIKLTFARGRIDAAHLGSIALEAASRAGAQTISAMAVARVF